MSTQTMSVVNLEALARAYQSTEYPEPELLVLGYSLPDSHYEHGPNWNAILTLGKHRGKFVRYYNPRSWTYYPDERGQGGGVYQLHYRDEPTLDSKPPHVRDHEGLDHEPDETYVDFSLSIPEGTIDRIIFLNPCNDGEMLPVGAELLTDDGIVNGRRVTR